MRAPRPWRLAKALAGASLTLLALALLAPGSATAASCDHPADRPSLGLEAFRLDGSGPTQARDQAPRPKPCDGPSCSNKPAPAPASTSAPQPPPRAELWGVLSEPSPVDPPGSAPTAPEAGRARPIRLATPVFHPPR